MACDGVARRCRFSDFFVFSIRGPPCSTLFPYTTLFRSSPAARVMFLHILTVMITLLLLGRGGGGQAVRSEEHTSELQSHSDLVCRLLLEKKIEFDSPTAQKLARELR